ncbi:PilZ domain-containing protein [Marinobacter sp.]|uniref:PilZ domain-containing protein n=1 Tax=Marinobacter sp. TaxID=50741 RepID=UPI00356A158D
MSPDPQNPDRRNFFRIEDRIGLEYHPLSADDTSITDPFSEDHLDGLKAELKRLDQEFRSQLPVLAERDRLAASLFKSLNGKIDTLARIMAFEQNPLQPQQWRNVTLSEGGVSFLVPRGEFAVGDVMALRLTLPPELYRPRARAEVVELSPTATNNYAHLEEIHTTFIDISEADRQQIAKHVMRWQIRQRQGGHPSQ